MTTQEIKQAVERAIPLNETCEIVRTAQIEARASIRVLIAELLRELRPYDPRTAVKDHSHPQY